jgi:superfamily II DNA or RNA helicase
MITLRPDQQLPVSTITRCKRGIVVAPAGSGKTIIAAAALDRVLRARIRPERARIYWIANTIEQCQQARDAMALFPAIAELADVDVGCYAAQPDLSGYACVIADECHHVASECNRRVFARCKGVIWGFTATPIRADGLDITEVIGNVVCEIERGQLVEDGNLALGVVQWIDIPATADTSARIDAEYNKLVRHWWADEVKNRCLFQQVQKFGIFQNSMRNKIIVEKANELIRLGHSVIILVGSIEHGRGLVLGIDGAEMAWSGMGKRNRARLLDGFKGGAVRCIVATQILEEGFDAPVASALINAAGGKSSRKSVQTTGRVLRPHKGKEHGLIIDFMDLTHGMLTAQSWQRRKTYTKLNYKQG